MRKASVLYFLIFALFHFGSYFIWLSQTRIVKKQQENPAISAKNVPVLRLRSSYMENLVPGRILKDISTRVLKVEAESSGRPFNSSNGAPYVKPVGYKSSDNFYPEIRTNEAKLVSRSSVATKLEKSKAGALTTLEISSHSIFIRSILSFNEIFSWLRLSRSCIYHWRKAVHHALMKLVNNFFVKASLRTNYVQESKWKWQMFTVVRFLSSLQGISEKCPATAMHAHVIRASDAQYLIDNLEDDFIRFITFQLQSILSIINALKGKKLKNFPPIICEQILQVSAKEQRECVTTTKNAIKVISINTSNTYKSRKKRFLPIIDDISPAGIDRDDRPYMYDTQVFLIDLDDSNKHLKFLYPLKLALGFLTYGLIGVLAYAIHLMPFIGPKGPQGEKGFKGWKGYPGWRGQHGDEGEQGDVGMDGFVGRKGWMGLKGRKGAEGHPGDIGPRGLKGSKGKQGKKGHKGRPGDVSDGDIGSKGEDGLPGPTGFDGYEINIQGKNPHKHKNESAHKIITYNHTHEHYHDHSHEHHHDSAIELSVHTKSPPLVGNAVRRESATTPAVLREPGVLTHHILLNNNEVDDIKSLTSEEISALITSQLGVGASGPTAVEILGYPQARLLMIPSLSNYSARGVPGFKRYVNDVHNANFTINAFEIANSSNGKLGNNFSHARVVDKYTKVNERWLGTSDGKSTHQVSFAHLHGDMALLRRINNRDDDADEIKETNTESNISAIPTYKTFSSTRLQSSSSQNNSLKSLRKFGIKDLKFVRRRKQGIRKRRRRNAKGEFLQLPEKMLAPPATDTIGLTKNKATYPEHLLGSIHALWKESKMPFGCVPCILFQCLEEQQAINLDSFIMAGFAHILGAEESLRLLDGVTRGRARGVGMRCQKIGRTCYLNEL